MARPVRVLPLVVGPLLAFLVFHLFDLGLGFRAQAVLAITVLAVVYWFTEVVELHVTGLLVSFLLILLAGFTPKEIFPSYFDPVVVLLLGGFVLAIALRKYNLDHWVAHRLLSHLGDKPSMVLLGFMFLTAFLSLWVSNTAAAALMIPIGLFVIRQNKLDVHSSPFSKSFVLGIAYAATIGGIGSLVGSTPNPLAAKYISDLGTPFGFWNWLMYGLPFALIFIFVIWFVIQKMFPSEVKRIRVRTHEKSLDKNQKKILVVFAITVLLWATDVFTGIPVSVVALVPILLLYGLRLIDNADFSKVDWPILILIGSGIILGSSFQATKIDTLIASFITQYAVGLPLFLLFIVLAVVGVLITMFASNTAAAALMIPLALPLAPALGISPTVLIMVIAISVSLDFTAPMGTPPNAIAYSTGAVKVKEMAKAGLLLSAIAIVLLSLFASFIWTAI